MKRMEISYFDGVNSLVGSNIGKKNELKYIENARSEEIGTIEKRGGTRRLGSEIAATANYGLFYFENSTNNGFYRCSTVGAVVSIYYAGATGAWTILGTGGTGLTAANTSHTFAEENCFIVNGNDANRYIESDGTTVVTSTIAAGHLYNSPKGYKVNFYKDRLYIADIYISSTRKKNGIQQSSTPLGVVALVSGDHVAGVTSIEVTDTTYIHSTDTLQVYRGGSLIETLTITAKTENTITVSATSSAILSADELWVNNTFIGKKIFRWVNNSPSGAPVKEYDTFYLTGNQNDSIKMLTNIGNMMVIANKNNLAIWNDYNLQNLDLGIGCVSDFGFVKTLGGLWFLHYTGIFATNGSVPKLMSAKVQKYIDGATIAGLEAAAAGKKGESVFFAIGDVTLYNPDGSIDKTLSDVCLEYNMRQENWYVHTEIDATIFATYIADDNPDRLEYASKDSKYNIYELFNTEQDSGEEIPFRIDTENLTLAQNFENFSRVHSIIVEVERGSGMECFVSLDNEPFYQIKGNINKGCAILKVTSKDSEQAQPPRCRRIKISIRDFTKKKCKISRMAVVYEETSETENQV